MRRIIALAAASLCVPALALARSPSPQIACWQGGDAGFARLSAPANCTVIAGRGQKSPSPSELAQLSGLQWSRWGATTATATGTARSTRDDGSSVSRSATVSVYSLIRAGSGDGCPTGRRLYTRMRVSSGGSSRVYDVAPIVGRCGDTRP